MAQALLGKCTRSNLEIGCLKRALRGFYFVAVLYDGRSRSRSRFGSGEVCVGEESERGVEDEGLRP